MTTPPSPTWCPPLPESAARCTAVETHGGRSSVSNNTSNNYATFANVVPSFPAAPQGLSPNNIVVANNSITSGQNGIVLTGVSGRTIQNVSITGNTIQVSNGMRLAQTNPPNFAGIVWNGTAGDLDGLEVSNNIISMDTQNSSQYVGYGSNNGGILLYTPGNLYDVLVAGNTFLSERSVVKAILEHLGLPTTGPRVARAWRSPPH